MTRHQSVFVLLAFSFLFVLPRSACPQEKDYLDQEDLKEFKSARVTKTVGGLVFDVEADRPIEKVGGIYQPVSIDTYVAIKAKKLREGVEERLGAFEERLEALEARVEDLEERNEEAARTAIAPQETQETPAPPGPPSP